ncbi:MAG: Methylenetetrahydrofolate reductase [Frankiales bacterium]|nr:Methylenetetrahydrofolate reductase [Frankiales bacterium]
MTSPGCPKRMVYGPCGGVRDDGRCEMVDTRCVFVDGPPVAWALPVREVAPSPVDAPLVLTDLTVRPFDAASVQEVVRVLDGSCTGLLVGEHQHRPDFPPTLMASLVVQAGGSPWTTLTCRDRNRVVLEQEVEGLRVAGAAGVLCVTGDGRAHGTRPEVTQVFDVDSTRLTALVSGTLPVAVAEAPEAVPQQLRPHRVLAKQQAGASLCVLNHVSDTARVAAFVSACRALGVTLPFVAAVAVYTDERSARVLQAFPGLHLDDVAVERVLAAPDPVAAGVAAAVTEARALLAVDGVVGVNLSGLASSQGERFAAHVKAEIGRTVLEEAAA